MKERPILFSTELVKEILAGRKTMTRRIMNPQPSEEFAPSKCQIYEPARYDKNGDMYQGSPIFGCYDINGEDEGYKSKYGQIGDFLWVREAWADVTDAFDEADEIRNVAFRADNSVWDCYGQMVYLEQLGDSGIEVKKWKPSIHLPKFASRLTLEIKDIRVERIQDISEKDAIAEGVSPLFTQAEINAKGRYWKELDLNPMPWKNYLWNTKKDNGSQFSSCKTAKESFKTLWFQINGEKSWIENPWVWVIEFQKITNN